MKLYYNLFRWLFGYHTFCLAKTKNVAWLSEKFEISLKLWWVSNSKHFAGESVKFDFLKVDGVGAKWYVESFRIAFALQIYMIATFADHFKLADVIIITKSRSVNHFDPEAHLRWNNTWARLDRIEIIRKIRIFPYDIEISLHLWTVLQY